MKYRTKDGDRIDTICAAYYGHLNGTVEAVYKANPNLAGLPPILHVGIVIELPELAPQQKPSNSIKLWD
ncbi:tail protein X [Pseudoalteromonas sp. MMG013]|uniref:tail protein X n=1 Tax=Pseudoalteromonas sp. MMG013 TaxID=2822687 RepID=UPI001B36DDF3|nr:tail protein X [Pseudoalteromonas sp. MMG013]MBQ4860527.1 tail protein X [Pseudoalteromonas sp. MMG013]